MLKQQKGVTLLALVFTIIAMLALAAIAIAMVLDELSYDSEPIQVEAEQDVVVSTDNVNEEIVTPAIDETPENNAN